MAMSIFKSNAQYFGILGVMFEWTALAAFYIIAPGYFDGRHPISFFATLPQTRIIFAACYILAAVSFWIFFKYHVSRYFETPLGVIFISLVCFVAVALLPYHPANDISNFAHALFFLVSSVTFMHMMQRITSSLPRSMLRTNLGGLVLISVISFIAFLSFNDSSLTLVLEAGWWLVLQVWILVLSFAGFSKQPFRTT